MCAHLGLCLVSDQVLLSLFMSPETAVKGRYVAL